MQTVKIFTSTLDKRKDDRVDRAKRLSARLKEYEEILDLKERKETLSHLMEYQEHIKKCHESAPFQMDLQGYQMQKLDQRIHQIGEISDSDALQLLDRNEEEFYQYLFYTSARYIKTLEEPKYQELREIFRFRRKSRDTGAGIQQIHAEIRKCKKAAACFSNHYHYLHIGT